MKVEESTVVGEEERVGLKRNEEKVVDRKRKCRRTRRRVQPSSTVIQSLYLACKKVFKGPGTVPEPEDVEMLQVLLDSMKPEDVGLSANMLFFKGKSSSKGTPRITYTTIYNCQNFSMCIFFLPPTGFIPLHNHPGMTVFSKLLIGSMHIKSYDWIEPVSSNDSTSLSELRAAKLVLDSDFTAPCDTSILYPTTGGNIHTFRAITACAVLDILGPPYSTEDGHDCTYYRDYPFVHRSDGNPEQSGEQGDQLGWLQEIDIPKDLKMDGVEYLGPQVIECSNQQFQKILQLV